MSFGGGGQAPPPPTAPPPPPNAPMFGANAFKSKAGGGTPPQFNSTVIGGLPTQTAVKSLLGQ